MYTVYTKLPNLNRMNLKSMYDLLNEIKTTKGTSFKFKAIPLNLPQNDPIQKTFCVICCVL